MLWVVSRTVAFALVAKQQVPKVVARLGVEARAGLIQDQDWRFDQCGDADEQATLQATG